MSSYSAQGDGAARQSRGDVERRRTRTSRPPVSQQRSARPTPPPQVSGSQARFHSLFWGGGASNEPSDEPIQWPTPDPLLGYRSELAANPSGQGRQTPQFPTPDPYAGFTASSGADQLNPQAVPAYREQSQYPAQQPPAYGTIYGQQPVDWAGLIRRVFNARRSNELRFSEICQGLERSFPGYDNRRDQRLVMDALRTHFTEVRAGSNIWRSREPAVPSGFTGSY